MMELGDEVRALFDGCDARAEALAGEMRGLVHWSDSRSSQLGVAVSSSLAAAQCCVDRLTALEAVRAQISSRCEEQEEAQVAMNPPKEGLPRLEASPALPAVVSTVRAPQASQHRSEGRPHPGGNAAMPIGLPIRAFFRRSGDGSYERDAQTLITIPVATQLVISFVPHDAGQVAAQAFPPATRAKCASSAMVEAITNEASGPTTSSPPIAQASEPPLEKMETPSQPAASQKPPSRQRRKAPTSSSSRSSSGPGSSSSGSSSDSRSHVN